MRLLALLALVCIASAQTGNGPDDMYAAVRTAYLALACDKMNAAGLTQHTQDIAANDWVVFDLNRGIRTGRVAEKDALPRIVQAQESNLKLLVGESKYTPKQGASVISYAKDIQSFGASYDVSLRYAQNSFQAVNIRDGMRSGTIQEMDGYRQLVSLQSQNIQLLSTAYSADLMFMAGLTASTTFEEEDTMNVKDLSLEWSLSQSLWRTNNIRQSIVNGSVSLQEGGAQLLLNVKSTFSNVLAWSGMSFYAYGSDDWSSNWSSKTQEITTVIKSLYGAGISMADGIDFMLTLGELSQFLASVEDISRQTQGESQSTMTLEDVNQSLQLQASALSALGLSVSAGADGTFSISTDSRSSLDVSMGELLITLGFSPSVAIDLQNVVQRADEIRVNYDRNQISVQAAAAEIDRLRDLSLSILGSSAGIDISTSGPGSLELSVNTDGTTITADTATASLLYKKYIASNVEVSQTPRDRLVIGFIGTTDADLSGSISIDGKVQVQAKGKASDVQLDAKGYYYYWDVYYGFFGSGDSSSVGSSSSNSADALVSFRPLAVSQQDVVGAVAETLKASGAAPSDANSLSSLIWRYYHDSVAFARNPLDESAFGMDDWGSHPAFMPTIDLSSVSLASAKDALKALGYDHNVCEFVMNGIRKIIDRMGKASDVCLKIATDASISVESEPVYDCFVNIMGTMSTAPVSEPFMTSPVSSASNGAFYIQEERGTPAPAAAGKPSTASSSQTGLILGSVIGGLLLVSLVALFIVNKRSRHTARYHLMPEHMQEPLSVEESY